MKLLKKLGILVLLLVLVPLQKLRLIKPFNHEPAIWEFSTLVRCSKEITAVINGKEVPARPQCTIGTGARLKAAWEVFTGRADALRWPEGQ